MAVKKGFKHEAVDAFVVSPNAVLQHWADLDVQGMSPGEDQFTDETYQSFGKIGDTYQRQTFKNVTVSFDKLVLSNENPQTGNPYPDELSAIIRDKSYITANMLSNTGKSDQDIDFGFNYKDPKDGLYRKHLYWSGVSQIKESPTHEINNVEKRSFSGVAERSVRDGVGAIILDGFQASNSIVPTYAASHGLTVGPGAMWLRVGGGAGTIGTSSVKFTIDGSVALSGATGFAIGSIPTATTSVDLSIAIVAFVQSGTYGNSIHFLAAQQSSGVALTDTEIQSWVAVQNSTASWIKLANVTLVKSLATVAITQGAIAKTSAQTFALSRIANQLDLKELNGDSYWPFTRYYSVRRNGIRLESSGGVTTTSSMVQFSSAISDMVEVIYPTSSTSFYT
jgi:hypothetical protein